MTWKTSTSASEDCLKVSFWNARRCWTSTECLFATGLKGGPRMRLLPVLWVNGVTQVKPSFAKRRKLSLSCFSLLFLVASDLIRSSCPLPCRLQTHPQPPRPRRPSFPSNWNFLRSSLRALRPRRPRRPLWVKTRTKRRGEIPRVAAQTCPRPRWPRRPRSQSVRRRRAEEAILQSPTATPSRSPTQRRKSRRLKSLASSAGIPDATATRVSRPEQSRDAAGPRAPPTRV